MIRAQLSFYNAVVLAVVLTFLGTMIFVGTRSSFYGAVDEELLRRGEFLRQNWSRLPKQAPTIPKPVAQDPVIDPSMFRDIEFEWYIARPRIVRPGEKATDKEMAPWDAQAMSRSLSGERLLFDSLIDGRRVRILSQPLSENGKVTGAAQFASNLRGTDAAINRLGSILLVFLPLSLLITSLIGVWLTRRALQPVRNIANAAEQIEATNLSGRLEVHGNDEFGHLASVFNATLGRLEAAFKKLEESVEFQRRFIADASHELKTPLTAIKTRIGVAKRQIDSHEHYPENLASIERSANAMSAVVSDLLLLARTDEGRIELGGRAIPVASLIEEAAAMAEDAYGRTISIDADSALTISGDENSLSRVIINLLDNAARHTPDNGTVRIEAIREGDRARIQVVDTGSGIPPENLPHIFDRFYRVSEARDRDSGGMGLGLAIVRSIVTAHGGDVTIESELGKGTIVTVHLPLA